LFIYVDHAAKEVLTYIVRHVRATGVRLRIVVESRQAALTLEDNGSDFSTAPDNATCDELRNMRERMHEIGGDCEIASQPGRGTRVTLVFPFQR
jgi:signal transduction histidine kinase